MKLSIFFAILGLLGLLLFGYLHEQVHVAVFHTYNIDSRIEYIKDFPNFVTYPDEPCPTNECKLANNINEAIGYHAMPFYFIMFLGIFIIIILLEEKNGSWRHLG